MNYHQAPRNARYAAPRPASEKQLELVRKLAGELHGAGVDAYLGDPEVVRALETAAGASELITGLIAASKVKRADKAGADKAEPGYYTRGEEFFVVVETKDGKRTYAKRMVITEGHKPSWVYAPGVGGSLARDGLEPLTVQQAAAFGHLHGVCIRGFEALVDPVSVIVGYGPVCAKRMGWDYPHTAAEKRAVLAAGVYRP